MKDVTTLLIAISVLVGLTNIITQVLKQMTWDKFPTNLLVVGISQVLTLIAFFAYCAICSIAILWYYVAAAVVLGFMVAYAAMFGFDKLKEIINSWISLKGEDKNE